MLTLLFQLEIGIDRNKLELLSQKLESTEATTSEHAKLLKELFKYRNTHIQEFSSFIPQAANILHTLLVDNNLRTNLLEGFISNQLRIKYTKEQVPIDCLVMLNKDILLHRFLADYFNKNLPLE